MKKYFGLFLTILIIKNICCAQTTVDLSSWGLNILDISPDSKSILAIERKDQVSDYLFTFDPESLKIIFRQVIDNKRPTEAKFINDSVIILKSHLNLKVQQIYGNVSTKEEMIPKINGENIKIDHKRGLIYFTKMDSTEASFDICRYDLKKAKTDRITLDDNYVQLGSYEILNGDSVVLNFENKMEMITFDTKKKATLLSNKGQKIISGGADIAITKDGNKILFSNLDDRFYTYNINNKRLVEIKKLRGCVGPLLAPNDSLLIVLNYEFHNLNYHVDKKKSYKIIRDLSFLNE